jgi:hypothetical protein
MNNQLPKLFVRTLKTHSLRIERGTNHWKVYTQDNRMVCSFAHTGHSNTLREAMRELRKQSLVDDNACRLKF